MHLDWLKNLRGVNSGKRRSTWQSLGSTARLEERTLLSASVIGLEVKVNTYTTNLQTSSAVAVDADGDYVIAWSSLGQDGDLNGVYAQRYNFDGTPQGGEFQVNTYTTSRQFQPAVAMEQNGDFVIAWTSFGQDGSGYGIYAQRYNAAGTPLGTEFHVSSYTTSLQHEPSIAMDQDGDFVIAWSSYFQDGSKEGIYAQRYDSAGAPQGIEFHVSSHTEEKQYQSSVAMDQDGDFVVTWTSILQDGSMRGVYAQRYNAAGLPQGTEFQVNTYTTNTQHQPSIAMDQSGDFVIAWSTGDQDGSTYGIYAQRYNSLGVALGTEFQVNTYTTNLQNEPSVAMDQDGDFVIAWTSLQQDGSDFGIFAQRFKADGTPQATEFLVNSHTTALQNQPSIAMDQDGDFIVAWQSVNQDGSSYGIYSQRYRPGQPDFLGTWRTGMFYLDSNHSRAWEGSVIDTLNPFGATTDKPLVGDWNGDGHDDIGIWRNGLFSLDANGNGIWDSPTVDKQFTFGNTTDTPIAGDWNRDGRDDIGIWRAGRFYLDLNGNRIWESGLDVSFVFGNPTDKPIVGDWNSDGIDDVGVVRNAVFYLDLNGNRAWNLGVDSVFTFGNATDTPLVGDWNADGADDIGIWRAGQFYLDSNGNRVWNSGVDQLISYGSTTDTPLTGYWRTKAAPVPSSPPQSTLADSSRSAQISSSSPPLNESTLASLIVPLSRKWKSNP